MLSGSIGPSQQSTDLNEAIATEIRKSGLAVAEKELETRIQAIVRSMMTSNTQTDNKDTQQPMEVIKEKEDTPSLADYSEDERKAKAKVLINLARTHHDK